MKRVVMFLLGSAVAVTVVAAAIAQTETPSGGQGSDASQTQSTQPTTSPSETAPPASTPPAQASGIATEKAKPKLTPAVEKAMAKGRSVDAKQREDVDKKLDEIEKQIETEASSKGDATVAGRIAGEFGLTADALTAERTQYGRGWGEILVAHTIFANAKGDLTIADVYQMRSEGMGWGQITHGLDLNLGELVSAVRTEGRVATGLTKPDGKPAIIHAGGKAAVDTKTAVKTEHTKGAAAAGAGVGVGVDLNKGAAGK